MASLPFTIASDSFTKSPASMTLLSKNDSGRIKGGTPSGCLERFPLARPETVLPFLLMGAGALSSSAEFSVVSVDSSFVFDSTGSELCGDAFSVLVGTGVPSGIRYATAERWKFRLRRGREHL